MLVLWGARSGDVQAGSREDRDAQPPWPGVLRFLASLEHAGARAGERFRLEPRQEEAMRRLFHAPYLDAGPTRYEFVGGRPVRVGER